MKMRILLALGVFAALSPAPTEAASIYSPGDVVYGFESEIFRVAQSGGTPELIAFGDLLADREVAALELDQDGAILAAVNGGQFPSIVRIDPDTAEQSTLFAATGRPFIQTFGNLVRDGGLLFVDHAEGVTHSLFTIDLSNTSLSVMNYQGFLRGGVNSALGILPEDGHLLVGAARIDLETGFQTLELSLSSFDMARFPGGIALATFIGLVLWDEASTLTYVPSPVWLQHVDLASDGRLAALSETEVFLIDPADGAIQTLVTGLNLRRAERNGGLVVAPNESSAGPLVSPEPSTGLLVLLGLAALRFRCPQ